MSTTKAEYLSRVPQGVAFSDGRFIPLKNLQISIADLGFTQSAATYDVAHVVGGRFFRLDWHLERFFQSAQGLYLPIQHSEEEITDILRECVIRSNLNDAFVWMGVTQGIPVSGNPRAYEEAEPRFYAYAKPYYGISSERGPQTKPVNISISDIQRIPVASVDPSFKNHAWPDLRLAQIKAKQQGYDTTVLLDEKGSVSEGPGFNIAMVADGVIKSPGENCLGGITIKAVEILSQELNIPFERTRISVDELRRAEEVFLTSTSGGITPVITINRGQLRNSGSGPITEQLQEAYWQKHKDSGWTTPVRTESDII